MLERIRAKNADTKTQYALIGAGLVTGIIGLVWISTLPARFAEKINLSPDEETQDLFEESGISGVVTDTKSQLGNIIDSIPSDEAEAPREVEVDGALGTLGDKSNTEITNQNQNESNVIENGEQEDVSDAIPKSVEPRVILIGTTTSQKSE